MKAIIPVMIVALLGQVAVAQETGETPTAIIAKAELVETQEGDFALALRLYEQVLATKTLDASLRSDALLKKAQLEHKLGRVDAAKVSLEKAAQGSGESATRAQRLLETGLVNQEEPGAWQVSGRVHRAIAKLYDRDSVTAAVNELQIIGESAIPALAEAMRNEKKDIGFITHGVQAMLAINGPRASKWFASVCADPDLIYRRTVMDALRTRFLLVQGGVDALRALDSIESLRGLLEGHDADVVLTALRILGALDSEVEPATVLRILERLPTSHTREVVMALTHASLTRGFLENTEQRRALVARLVALTVENDENLTAAIGTSLNAVIINHPQVEAVDLFLQYLRALPEEAEAPGLHLKASNLRFYPIRRIADHLKEFTTAQVVAFREHRSRGSKTAFGTAYDVFQNVADKSKFSTEEVLAVLDVFELVGRRGSNRNLESRIVRGDSFPAARVLECAPFFDHVWPLSRAAASLATEGSRTTSVDLAPLEERLLSHGQEEDDDAEFYGAQVGLLNDVARAFSADAIPMFMRLVDRDQRFYPLVADALTWSASEAATDARRDLIRRAYPGELAAAGRNAMLIHLLAAGNKDSIPTILAGLAMPLAERAQSGTLRLPSISVGHAHRMIIYVLDGWSAEDGLSLVKGVLELEAPLKWDVISGSLRSSTARKLIKTGRISQDIIDLLVESAFEAPSPVRGLMIKDLVEGGLSQVASVRLLEGMARTKEFVYMSAVIEALPRPTPEALVPVMKGVLRDAELPEGNRQQILGILAGLELQEMRPELVAALDAPSSIARMHAMSGLFNLDRASALEDMIKLKDSPDHQVRARLCQYLGLEPRRESIPVLIEMLKDSSHDVRAAADSALRQIEFYFEQRNRWDKWLKKAGLDSTDAASALLEQAAPGQPLEQRVIAIQSLGTLAKAETLPILIGWMTDESPEVAAAARAAVNKINGQ